jgi:ribosome recycling factor
VAEKRSRTEARCASQAAYADAQQVLTGVLRLESSMSLADVKKNTQERMTKSLETLRADLAKVRTGRAHTGILDHVMVDYYGSPTALTQVANVTLIDARTIGVQPYEKKMANTIEKAIRDADLGLNPSAQGDLIRVPTPPLTEERRKEMVKLVKSEAEDAKIAVRNIRRDANESLKKLVKEKACSEDDERRSSEEVQKLTDKFIADIDKMVVDKEKEVLTV